MANPSNCSQGVSGTQLRSELAQIAIETIEYSGHTITFQPRTKCRNEDRHLVKDWKLSNGTWKFIGVSDGSRNLVSDLSNNSYSGHYLA
jgi:hypothetical protein